VHGILVPRMHQGEISWILVCHAGKNPKRDANCANSREAGGYKAFVRDNSGAEGIVAMGQDGVCHLIGCGRRDASHGDRDGRAPRSEDVGQVLVQEHGFVLILERRE
jgi:hypothetical protein